MKYKTVISALLLLIVAAAVVVIATRSLKTASPVEAVSAGLPTDYIAVTYFHGDRRCQTCETIEAYAADAVQAGFASEIADGRLRWSTINYDRPTDAHYMQDYGLSYQMVIVAEFRQGIQQRWVALPRIWDLVQDKDAFVNYVQTEINKFMQEH